MSFWEVSVDRRLIAQERSSHLVLFHLSFDSALSDTAMQLHMPLKALLLFVMVAALNLSNLLAPHFEPVSAHLCFYLTGLFMLVSLHHRLTPLLTAPLIERRWVKQFQKWLQEIDHASSDSDLDLDYLRTHDRRLDVIMARLSLGERVTTGSWKQTTPCLFPKIRDFRFFVRFWIRRSETAAVFFGLATILLYFGLRIPGLVLAGTTSLVAVSLVATQVFGWLSSSSEMLRYFQVFHPKDEILGPEGLLLGIVSEGTLRQLRSALDDGSTERVSYWIRRFLNELLRTVDPYRYPDVLRDIVEPRLVTWYGKPLDRTAKDAIANFER